MRRRPRDLLNDHAHARMAALELGHELLDDLAFAPEGPEADHPLGRVGAARGAGPARQKRAEERDQRAARSSHPPVKPARFRPATMYGFLRIVRQTSSER